jgi:hypothetical protein
MKSGGRRRDREKISFFHLTKRDDGKPVASTGMNGKHEPYHAAHLWETASGQERTILYMPEQGGTAAATMALLHSAKISSTDRIHDPLDLLEQGINRGESRRQGGAGRFPALICCGEVTTI